MIPDGRSHGLGYTVRIMKEKMTDLRRFWVERCHSETFLDEKGYLYRSTWRTREICLPYDDRS